MPKQLSYQAICPRNGMVPYSPAKTVSDCFKYRSKLGQGIALDALRETWRARRATISELWEAAQVCRVTSVMRPYREILG